MNLDLVTGSELLLARVPYHRLSDYFGLWGMHEPSFAGMFDMAARMDFPAHFAAKEEIHEKKAAKAFGIPFPESDSGLQMTAGGIAVISLRGTLMKAESSWSDSTSTVVTRQRVRAAKANPDVAGVLFVIESPGGTVAGTSDLADDIAALTAAKPTASYCEDLCASAAYWNAAQTGRIATGPTGLVGSIGTFMAVRDTSGMAKDMKVKVHVIKAGQFKGAGVPGTEVTDEQLAEWQAMVNQLNDQFLAAVSRGRKMSLDKVAAVATGSVFVGQAAVDAGLVDAVESMDETIRQLMEQAGSNGGRKKSSSSKGNSMAAATFEELEANLIGADADFLVGQMKAKADLPTASKAWMAEQGKRLEASKKAEADAKERADLAAKNGPSNKGIGNAKGKTEDGKEPEGEGHDGDAIAEFHDAVEAAMAKNGGDRDAAVISVAKRNPKLHVAFKQATNPEFAAQIGHQAKKLGIQV